MTAQFAPDSRAAGTGGRRRWWIVAGSAVAVLLLCLFVVRFTAGGGGAVESPTGLTTSAVESPTGLTTSADGSTVTATWTGTGDADGYRLIRDDSVVVYEGGDTTFTDAEAPTGTHEYTVRAVRDGAMSAPTASSEITVGASWGRYLPYVSQFPDLLPQTPDSRGWNDIECSWAIDGFQGEFGSAETGSGQPQSVARVNCYSGEAAVLMAWIDSKSATDEVFANASKKAGMEPIKWRYGTGYLSVDERVAHLRMDTRGDLWIGLGGPNGATREQMIALANDLPIE